MNRSIATLAFAPLLLAACAMQPTTGQPGGSGSGSTVDQGQLTLGVGQSANLADGSLLAYTRLVNDSRCAPDVQCVWEGDAEIALRWKPASGAARDINLHTSPKGGSTTASIGQRRVTLVSLERGVAPEATLRIDPNP